MKKLLQAEAGYVLSFLGKVVFQWVTLLLFLPDVYDFLHVYFPEPIRSFELSGFWRWVFVAIAIFIAVYRVWRKEHLALQEAMRKKTRFKVVPVFFRLSVDKKLKEIDQKIQELEEESKNLPVESVFDQFMSVGIPRRKTRQSNLEYIQSLKEYQKELKIFHKRSAGLVGVDVSLEADKYDENISVEFSLDNGNLVSLYDLDRPLLPSDPAKDWLSSLPLIDPREREVYRTNLERDHKSISCDLRYLKKGQPTWFINEAVYIKTQSEEIAFTVYVTSKNSDGRQEFSFSKKKSEIKTKKDISKLSEFD